MLNEVLDESGSQEPGDEEEKERNQLGMILILCVLSGFLW